MHVHGIGHGAIRRIRERAPRPETVAERRDRCGQSERACRADPDCRRRSSIWPADRRSDCRSHSLLRIFPVPLPARPDCWNGFAAPRPNARLIVASSAAVYGADHSGPISEDAALAPMSPYGQHKLMMEQLCRSYAVDLRLSQHRRAVVLGLRAASCASNCCGICVPGCSRGERDAGSGRNRRRSARLDRRPRRGAVVDENRASCRSEKPFRLSTADPVCGTSVADIASMLVKHWGRDIACAFPARSGQGTRSVCWPTTPRLRQLPFDWRIPIDRGLADYVRWFKDQVR